MKKHFIPTLICIILISIIIALFAAFYNPYKTNNPVNSTITFYQSSFVISTMELISDFLPWTEYIGKKIFVSSPVAYEKVIIENDTPQDKSYYIINRDINTKGKGYEAVRFEMVPLPVIDARLNKSVFHVSVPANSASTFIIEFKSDSLIYLHPIVLDELDFYATHATDLFFECMIFTIVGLFTIYLIIQFVILRNETYYFVAGVSIVVTFFYTLKTRFLVFMFGPVMNSICYSNFITNFAGRVSFLIVISFITVLFISSYKTVHLNWKFCYICFIPWILISVFESVTYVFKKQFMNEYSSLFAFMLCQITFSVLNIYSDKIRLREKQDELISYFTFNHKISFDELIATKTVSTKFLVLIREQLQQPLEIILAISNLMEKTQDYTKIVAYSKAIEEYILQMKTILGLELQSASQSSENENLPSVTNIDMQKEFASKDFEEYKNSAVCVYGNRATMDLSIKMILSSEGFFCVEEESQDDIVSDIQNGKIQMIVIDPTNNGDEAFDLCRRIREEFNMLQLPIIMIINYYANHLVRAGYSAGVNDFVIRPFDSAELISRCYLLLQQHKIYTRNKELARMENEKSTFLYFVTHNVNTPLTLLINRMEELYANLNALNVESEVVDDMRESVNEINDIIQNVLISFRISDGRFINTQEFLFIEDILDNVRPQIESKAKLKNVKIDWNISELLPQVHCNKQALRGIMVNLLDNAVKYATDDGYVQVYAGKVNGRIKFSVSDNGMGVDSDKISSLFTRFESVAKDYNKNRPSVGLGLYVANELAKMNGIKIEYTDADIGGACFSLIFPQEC
ncbi:MAG: response regulator [Treponema sp.]|nr:response regulator [Treponema sp.]